MKPPCKEYCCKYYHDGAWWGINITAYDDADAGQRVAKLGNLQLLGELDMTIPANIPMAGLMTRIITAFKNLTDKAI